MQFYFVTISISIVLIDISIAKIYFNHQARSVFNYIRHEYSPDHLSIVSFDQNDINVQKMIRHLLSPKTLSKWDHYNLVSFCMPKPKAIHNGVKQTLTNTIAITTSIILTAIKAIFSSPSQCILKYPKPIFSRV